jgi:hypothetical protein
VRRATGCLDEWERENSLQATECYQISLRPTGKLIWLYKSPIRFFASLCATAVTSVSSKAMNRYKIFRYVHPTPTHAVTLQLSQTRGPTNALGLLRALTPTRRRRPSPRASTLTRRLPSPRASPTRQRRRSPRASTPTRRRRTTPAAAHDPALARSAA